MRAPPPLERRFQLLTGKGGVGKTTLSIALALALTKRGKRVLHMQLGAHDHLGAVFGRPPVGPEIVELAPLLYAVNTTPADAMREYALLVLRSKVLYKAVFENRVVRRFLRMVPGLPELVMIGKAWYHEQERTPEGAPRWDAVIVDAPATGHGLFLLQIPSVITGALHAGMMVEESQKIAALLEDPARAAIHLVTLTEEMPVAETLELREKLARESRVQAGVCLANAVLPTRFSEPDAQLLHDLLVDGGDAPDALRDLLQSGVFRHQRCQLQQAYLERLERGLDLPVVQMPFLFSSQRERRSLEVLASALSQAMDAAQGGSR